uniref:Uncharacterized protein n=1 Tax=Wuchereria bancrofti TaxID=6293 RepID=A0AAF5PKD1_WUCBA
MMMLIMMTADENDNGDGMLCNDPSVDDRKCGIISMYRSVTNTLQLS